MAMRDPHRFVNELDEDATARLVARLESRAKDEVFVRLFDRYASRLNLGQCNRVLEVGCGTGATTRMLARRGDFSGVAYGVDQSRAFIEAAYEFARADNLGERVDFQVGDAHSLDVQAASFDVVIAHTLISHVTDPGAVLREMARVVRPGGTMVVFDGDYASLTYAFSDHEFGQQMDRALMNAVFNNPRIMRDLPRLLPDMGLALAAAWGDAVVEIGRGSYFKSFAETYTPSIAKAGVLPAQSVEAWLSAQLKAIEDGTFFAACNYYTYFIRPV